MSAIKLHVLMPLSTMDDDELLGFAGSIQQVGSQSSLFANAAIAAGINGITAQAASFSASCKAVKDTTKQLTDDKAAKLADRAVLETLITAFGGAATSVAKDDAGLAGLGLKARQPTVIPTLGPAAPGLLITKMPKYQRGYFDISADETGLTRGRYVAQSSADPIGVWTELRGTGKSRRVSGASGTRVWVRFARVRGQLQSAWSTPQLVIIP